MSFSVGIVGLPNVGKSTLFRALTRKPAEIAPYPFTTINPNLGVCQVPDERLSSIAELIKPEKVTPTIIEFLDIAGLVKGAHKGEGLGNQFLAQIRNCDAILEVIRAFEDEKVENVLGEINPEKEIETVKTELLIKDLETLDSLLLKLGKDLKKDKKALKQAEFLKKIKENVSQGKLISELPLGREEKSEIKEYQFLTQKPILYILNTGQEKPPEPNNNRLLLNLKLEGELSELSEKEREELGLISQLDKLIVSCYNILDLITFYTIALGKESRAWTLKKGETAPEAGGKVHSDFETNFIRAEVIHWQKLIEAGSWSKAKELGWLKTAGRDYIVQDGDVIEFKI